MNGSQDPVDSALDLLRREPFDAAPFTPDTERSLMQKFNTDQTNRRRRMRNTLAVAGVGVAALGSLAFASGAAQKLRQWMFEIELPNGETAKILVNDGQQGAMTWTDEHGATVTMHSTATETPDGNRATVIVRRDAGDRQSEGIIEAHQRTSMNVETGLDLSALEGADELGRHANEETGETVEVYGRAHADGGTQAYIVVTGVGNNPERRILAAPHLARLEPGTPASVKLENGMVDLSFDAGPDQQVRLKLFAGRPEDMPNKNIAVDVNRDTGIVKVRMPQDLNPNAPK